MGYAERRPSPALAGLVACTWAVAGPDGCIDILVLEDGRAQVVGTMRRAIVTPARDRPVIGIRFRPGEAARLLPVAPRELTGASAHLTELWTDDARPLQDALVRALDEPTRRRLGPEDILGRASQAIEAALRARLAAHGKAVDTGSR